VKKNKYVSLISAVLAGTLLITGCGQQIQEDSADDNGVRTIKVGYVEGQAPITYEDENGNVTGCDIEAMKEVAKLLPQYNFEFVGHGEQPAVYAGLQNGRIHIALTNSFWTEERAEKFLFPNENIGASIVGLFTTNDYPNVNNLEDAYDQGLQISPILAGDGLYYVVEEYNKENPDKAIKQIPTDDANAFTLQFGWVAEGRYGFGIAPLYYYDRLVAAEDGSYHEVYDDLRFETFKSVKTWTILPKGEDVLAADLDGAIKQLRESGKLVELAEKFHGYNTWENIQ
jgi:L-cystine transport system substrate-binding protein